MGNGDSHDTDSGIAHQPQLTETIADRLRVVIGDQPVNAFAAKVGISQQLLWKYLSGSTPGVDKLAAIAKAADVSLRWIATGEGIRGRWCEPQGAQVSQLVTAIEDVPREAIKAWIDDWWAQASPNQRAWLQVEFERHFPEFAEWKKKTERNSRGQCGA